MANKEKSGFKKVIQSKAFKGVSIAVASALIGAGVTYLATNSNSETKALVTMKGDTITVSDFYSAAKSSKSSQQTMLNLILSRVFEDQYGSKVSDKEVTEAYNKTASSYGSSFSSALQAAGLTTDTYKQQIRTSMLVEYAVKEAAKDKLTTKNYKEAYKDYTPDTTATVALSNEDKANSVHDQATADGADFDKIAKENTIAKKTEYTFDSADTKLPTDVMDAAFKQNEGSVSDVIKVMNSSTYSYTYYIVKTTKKTDKNSDWKTYKKRLKKAIMAKYQNDTNFQNQVIAKALDKANVKIKDNTFASILSQYATSSSSSSSASSSKASSTSSEASSSSSTEESSTTESSTDSAE